MKKIFVWLLKILFILILLYEIIGYFLIPTIGLRLINQQLANYSTVPAHLESIEFNPLSLKLTLHKLLIKDPQDKRPQIAFKKLDTQLDYDSLWTKKLHLKTLALDNAHVDVLFDQQGHLNLAQLFKLPEDKQEPQENQPLFPLIIDNFILKDSSLYYRDQQPKDAVEIAYNDINLSVQNLNTLPNHQGEMTFQAMSPTGGSINWKGSINLSPISSQGHIELKGLKIKPLAPYINQFLALNITQGKLSTAFDYQFAMMPDFSLKLAKLTSTLDQLKLVDSQKNPQLKLGTLSIADSQFDLNTQKISLTKIKSSGLELWLEHAKDGSINWQHYIKTSQTQDTKVKPESQQAKNNHDITKNPNKKNSTSPTSQKPWTITVNNLQLNNYLFHLTDDQPKNPVKLDIGPLKLSVSNFNSLKLDTPLPIQLSSNIQSTGKINAEGTVSLDPIKTSLDIKSENLDLSIAQEYIDPYLNLTLKSGLLSSGIKFNLQQTEPLRFTIDGDAEINNVLTLDEQQEDLVKWSNLKVDGIHYEQDKDLLIKQLTFTNPYDKFQLNQDMTSNFGDLVKSDSDHTQNPAENISNSEAKDEAPFHFHIGGIEIKNGSSHFMDLSINPSFSTAIENLNGHIGTIDNTSNNAADVDIKGQIDRYAPVSVKGSLTPFDPMLQLDIETRFQHVELTTLTPYAGKFAGYKIKSGRMDLDLNYKIQQGKLNAKHHIVLDKFNLGEKVDSPDAIDIPIKLAIALLKDPSGKIDLDIPTKGDLNDPQFSLAPIVLQSLKNLLLKTIETPFKLIAGLLPSGSHKNLGRVLFEPGSAELDQLAQDKLMQLAEALGKRPSLILEVTGNSSSKLDGPVLAEQRLNREYSKLYYKARNETNKPEKLDLNLSQKLPLAEQIYQKQMKQAPNPEWKTLFLEKHIEALEAPLLQKWSQSETQLRKLAQKRQMSIKNFLTDQAKLAPERTYLLDVGIDETPEKNNLVPTKLNLTTE